MRTVAVGLAVVLGAWGAGLVAGADAATIRIKCRDGGRASATGFGKQRDMSDACDADRTCDGRCTFVLASECIRCLVKSTPAGGCYCDTERRPPCPTGNPVVTLNAAPGSRLRIPKGQIGRTAFELLCRPNAACVAPTSTTLPPGIPDVGGVWMFMPDTTHHHCPPALAERFGRMDRITVEQDGSDVVACRNTYFTYQDAAFDGPDTLRLVSSEWGTVVDDELLDFQETLTATDFSSGGAPEATMTIAFEESGVGPGAPVCSLTATGSLIPAACANDADCIAADGCTRCVGARCRPVPRCRWEGWCIASKRRCLDPADYGGP